MKRKTNLFYSTGSDSNFVTFSNYTEALTGNILATDSKMFPSKFMCISIPKLNENYNEQKQDFIVNYLVAYYENKLALLRDEIIDENKQVDSNINPLQYLLDAIYMFDPSSKITFIDNICEQEYNGVFMDNICIIESSKYPVSYSLRYENRYDKSEQITSSSSSLYGWEGITNLPEHYSIVDVQTNETTPINAVFDETNGNIYYYKLNNSYSIDNLANNEIDDDIKFNVIVPMFDVMMFNLNDNGKTTISSGLMSEEFYDEDGNKINESSRPLLVLNNAAYHNQYDIPMGMWFSDKEIVLERHSDNSGTYRPSWSICISSQFKPFPYSNPDEYPKEIRESSNLDKFASFAMIMSKQAHVLNEFNSLNLSMIELNKKLMNIETAVSVNNAYDDNNSSSHDSSNSESISNLETKLSELETRIPKIYVSQDSLRSVLATNYVSKAELQTYVSEDDLSSELAANYVSKTELQNSGYLTETDLSNYITSSELSNYVSKTDYQSHLTNFATVCHIIGGGDVNGITQSGFGKNVRSIIDDEQSLLAKRVKNVFCPSSGGLQNSWLYLFRNNNSSELNNTEYTIPSLIQKQNNITTSYEAADSAIISSYEAADSDIMTILNSYGGRLSDLDGKDLSVGMIGIVPALISAMSMLENRLKSIGSVFSYLHQNLDILTNLNPNDSLQNDLINTLNNMGGTDWYDIYTPNVSENNTQNNG